MVGDTRPKTIREILQDTKFRNKWGRKTSLEDIDLYNASADDLFKTDDPLISSDTGVYTETMGQKVWDSLNNQTVFYNLLRKVPWGTDNGWRVRNARQTSSGPVSEDGSIPDSDVAAYKEVYSVPRWPVSHGEVSIQAQYLSNTRDGIGNAIGKEMEFQELDHIKEINKEMLLASAVECDTAVTNTTISLYTGMLANFRAGDTLAVVDDDSINTATLTTIGASDTITASTTATGDQYAVVCAQARAGITSLDDIVNVKLAATGTRDLSHAVGWPDSDVWNIDRSAATAAQYQDCALYSAASGTPRVLTTDLLDAAIRAIRENGGKPDLILTGWDQIDALANAEESKQRFNIDGKFTVKRGGESTLQGHQVGFDVATYRGIAVFGDNDVYKLNIDGTEKGSIVYVLDTESLEVAVAQQTQFYESDNFIAAGKLNYDFILYSGLELRCYDIRKQAKIWDLSAP